MQQNKNDVNSINKISQRCFFSLKTFILNLLRKKPIFISVISFLISLVLSCKVTGIVSDIFALLYALNEGVQLKDLSEDYGFGLLGIIFLSFSFFSLVLFFYFFIKKQIIRFIKL